MIYDRDGSIGMCVYNNNVCSYGGGPDDFFCSKSVRGRRKKIQKTSLAALLCRCVL